MRCQFCGWDNPPGKESCEKCNKPLSNGSSEEMSADVSQSNHDRSTDRYSASVFSPKATVREAQDLRKSDSAEPMECPKCGYPLENGECPACGYNASDSSRDSLSNVVNDARKTIRPIRKSEKLGEFKLVPISEETGLSDGDELSFEGNEVVLNRDNTDPQNTTITSQEQAYLSFENGKWSIEDRSELKTTFVQASRKIELQNDDLILIGNQLYRFEA